MEGAGKKKGDGTGRRRDGASDGLYLIDVMKVETKGVAIDTINAAGLNRELGLIGPIQGDPKKYPPMETSISWRCLARS